MQDNFNIHNWRLNQAINEMSEKKLCKECGEGYMEEGQCMECGYMEEATFTSKHDDNPELKGGQKDLPDEVQAKIVAKEGEDHEVAMAQSSLKAIISSASQLMSKLGNEERNIPGWIQDHITNAENYIEQANQGFHELEPATKVINTDIVAETVDNRTLKQVELALDLVSNLKSNTSTNSNIPTTDKQGLIYAFQEIEDLLEDVAADIEQEDEYVSDYSKRRASELDEAANPEGDKLVLRFLQGIAKKFEYPVSQAALFVKERIKSLGY